jgi:multiple sugar transport system substrate-binding protein
MNSCERLGHIAAYRYTRRRHLARDWAAAGTAWLVAGCGLPGAGGAGPAPAATCRSKLEFLTPATPGTQRHDSYTAVIQGFTRSRTGCTVEMIQVPSGEQLAKLTAMVAGGSPPALTEMPPGATKSWVAGGALAPVDDLFKRDKLTKDDFPAALWKQMSYQGKVWFMPGAQTNADFVLHWNKAHFREAGLDPEKGPTTIAELDSMIQRLTREQGGELERVGMQTWDLYGLGNTTQAWGYAFGGSFYDEVKDELTFTHPRLLRATEWYTSWARRLDPARVNRLRQAVTPPGGVHFFGSGRFSIHVLTSGGLIGVQKFDPSIQIGAGPMPAEAPGKPGTVTIGGWAVAAAAGGAQRDQAWDFLKYGGASEEGTLAVARTGGIPGWLKSPGMAELSKDPLWKAYVDGVRRAEYVQISFYSPTGYDLNPIQEVIDGKRSMRDALEAINRDANQRYADWKSKNRR